MTDRELIILVEDDGNLRNSLALILQRAGYQVTATECAYTAVNLIQSGKYQVLITDFNMPDTQNVLLPHVLDIYPYLSIVVLTDHTVNETDQENKLLSAQYLVKPIAPEHLLECIGSLMGNNSITNST